ncbi:MAG: hypothetical protein ACX930_02860 [Erythrobacter sp.]
MGRENAHATGRLEQAIIVGLLAAALAALAGLVIAPRTGEPVALVPLGASAAKAVPGLLTSPDTLLLARGSMPGSYIVRGKRPGFFESLSLHGVLVINATAPGCGPVGTGGSA